MRRMRPIGERGPFTDKEVRSITSAIRILKTRSLYHFVLAKHPLPDVDTILRGLAPAEVWDTLALADTMCLHQHNQTQHVSYTEACRLSVYGGEERLMPNFKNYPPVVCKEVVEYAEAAAIHDQQWNDVDRAFSIAQKCTRRVAAYYWPALASLLRVGGRPDPTLAECRAPTRTLPSEYPDAVPLFRATTAMLAKTYLLPKVPDKDDIGVSARFGATLGIMLPDFETIWPVSGG